MTRFSHLAQYDLEPGVIAEYVLDVLPGAPVLLVAPATIENR